MCRSNLKKQQLVTIRDNVWYDFTYTYHVNWPNVGINIPHIECLGMDLDSWMLGIFVHTDCTANGTPGFPAHLAYQQNTQFTFEYLFLRVPLYLPSTECFFKQHVKNISPKSNIFLEQKTGWKNMFLSEVVPLSQTSGG